MKWKKLGLIFCPDGKTPWMASHASVPIATHLDGDLFKIYFSSRDSQNRSSTGYVLINLKHPTNILKVSSFPVLSPGELGGFDDSGAMATWITEFNDTKYLYYIGWNLGITVPFRNSIGLAISKDGENFSKQYRGPILDRTVMEPHFCASCCVLPSVKRWRMWYLSCTNWSFLDKIPRHCYHIKYAESTDGFHWIRNGQVAIDFKNTNEYAISRPSVLHDLDCWKMWFSYRGHSYRIGYAESDDGIQWRRLDEHSGIDISASGWDSDMIEYPFVFDHDGSRYMLYNGNGYGKTGFGLAVLEQD